MPELHPRAEVVLGTPEHAARRLLDHVATRPASLGDGRLICVDGPAGSGKTTLAAAVEGLAGGATVLHTDDLLEGWDGLLGLAATLTDVVRPLAAGRPATWRRWDWLADTWAERHTIVPGRLLVVEGVGSWAPAFADLVTALVWVEADPPTRLARGLERDGEQMRDRWLQWRRDENRMHARFRTRDHADLVVDTREGTG